MKTLLDTARDEILNSSFLISEHFTQLWHNLSSFCPSTQRQKCRISPPKPHHYHHLPHRYSQIHTNLTFHGQTRLAPWLPAGHASCCGRARRSRHSSPPAEIQIKHTPSVSIKREVKDSKCQLVRQYTSITLVFSLRLIAFCHWYYRESMPWKDQQVLMAL